MVWDSGAREEMVSKDSKRGLRFSWGRATESGGDYHLVNRVNKWIPWNHLPIDAQPGCWDTTVKNLERE